MKKISDYLVMRHKIHGVVTLENYAGVVVQAYRVKSSVPDGIPATMAFMLEPIAPEDADKPPEEGDLYQFTNVL